VLGIVPPLNIDDLFNNWIKQGGVSKTKHKLIGVGGSFILGILAN
jgi:hypothetical protein